MLANVMNYKFVLVAAAALALAACESDGGSSRSGTGPGTSTSDSGANLGSVDRSGVDQGQLGGAAYQPGTTEHLEAEAGTRVFFGYDRYDLTELAQQTLRDQARWMRQYPNKSVTIEGHADERGTREYNLALGARRANAAKRFLVGLGIEDSRIRTISYGKERPEFPASNEQAYAKNRRARTLID